MDTLGPPGWLVDSGAVVGVLPHVQFPKVRDRLRDSKLVQGKVTDDGYGFETHDGVTVVFVVNSDGKSATAIVLDKERRSPFYHTRHEVFALLLHCGGTSRGTPYKVYFELPLMHHGWAWADAVKALGGDVEAPGPEGPRVPSWTGTFGSGSGDTGTYAEVEATAQCQRVSIGQSEPIAVQTDGCLKVKAVSMSAQALLDLLKRIMCALRKQYDRQAMVETPWRFSDLVALALDHQHDLDLEDSTRHFCFTVFEHGFTFELSGGPPFWLKLTKPSDGAQLGDRVITVFMQVTRDGRFVRVDNCPCDASDRFAEQLHERMFLMRQAESSDGRPVTPVAAYWS